ncbi:Uncharacterised protein [uncultured archaeon]|nr:Uncharacterised protein [uncultured archaeon]
MKYAIGDIVRFKLESGEVQEGDVQFVDRSVNENILYINGFCRWAYKVPEKRIISRVPARYKF